MPIVFIAITTFSILYSLNVQIWYYYIDASVAEVFFFAIMISCFVSLTKHQPGVNMKEILIRLLIPVIVGSAGYIFTTIYLNNKYKVANTTNKFLIRLLYFPLILEPVLIFQEFSFRTFRLTENDEACSIHGRAHFVFLTQVSFGILGRYMTTISGNLSNVALFSAVIAIKDISLHRMSRVQCWLAFKLKKLFALDDGNQFEEFEEWFLRCKVSRISSMRSK